MIAAKVQLPATTTAVDASSIVMCVTFSRFAAKALLTLRSSWRGVVLSRRGNQVSSSLIRALERRDALSDEERGIVTWMFAGPDVEYDAGQDIVREDSRPEVSSIIISGIAARYRVVRDGGRQFSAFHISGDFLDLHSFPLRQMPDGVVALSPTRIAHVPHQRLRHLTETQPHLSRLLWLLTIIDAAIHREWIISMGRRSARARLAHFLCEQFTRLDVVGLTEGQSFHLPLTQPVLADVLGLSTVHVNRIIQRLRKDGLVTWQDDLITIEDWRRLSALAEFDDTYLSLHKEPR
jgi:CRP-like cAMP-binding protein